MPQAGNPNPTAAKGDTDQELATSEFHHTIFFRERGSTDGDNFHPDDGIEPSSGAHHPADAFVFHGIQQPRRIAALVGVRAALTIADICLLALALAVFLGEEGRCAAPMFLQITG